MRLLQRLMFPILMFVIFWTLAIVLTIVSGTIFPLVNFGYIGTALGVGLGLYALLPRKRKPVGRKLAQFMVGGYMLVLLGLVGKENMQIEGFFFYLLSGFFAGAVMHYFIAKVFGPTIFGRGWCSWACWTAMILDLLPFDRPAGWVSGRWERLRYVSFALSLALVAVLWYGFGYTIGLTGARSFYWLVVGNAAYYLAAIPMAYLLKDNRAFCKYLCPITVILKATSRLSLLKVRGNADECNNCGACVKLCPMGIRIPDYIKNSQRVLSTECIICQTCITVCPRETLRLGFGFDLGGKELLVERSSASQPTGS